MRIPALGRQLRSRSEHGSRLRDGGSAPPTSTDEEAFIGGASGSGADTRALRMKLAERFAAIHKDVPCAHQEAEALILADAVLGLDVEGPLIELGCFKGGMTSKLSLVASATGRRLYACDSFTGLPEPHGGDAVHYCTTGRVKRYERGDYAGGLEEVQATVRTHGAADTCEFVPGLFGETLADLDIRPALVFMDVDLIESARTCLEHIWPRLVSGGRFFTHEATSTTFVAGLLDPDWWHAAFGRCPPVLFGAGFGFGPNARNLAYFGD